MDLNQLIQETTEKQKQGLVDFQTFFNLSTQLKGVSTSDINQNQVFLAKIITAFQNGEENHDSAPSNTTLAALWKVLLSNEQYVAALKHITLPSDGTPEERLAAISKYMNAVEQSDKG